MRLSFAGGGTDIADWYERHGGAVLSSTIDESACVTLRPRGDSRIRFRSLDLGWTVDYDVDEAPVYDGTLDLAKAAAARFELDQGFDLDIRSDAPAGSGLGGSAAVTSALVGALATYTGARLNRREMAELGYEIERTDLSIPGGKQDHYATTFGGFNHISFDADGVLVEPLRLDDSVLRDLEARLLLCYLGQVRTNLNLVDTQIEFLKSGRPATIGGMHSMGADVGRMKDALSKKNLDRFGKILHDAFVHKKMMNPDVTKGTVADTLYEVARAHGASGGKLAGAGGGGYMLLYVPTAKRRSVLRALEAMGTNGQMAVRQVRFADRGLQVSRVSAP